MTSTRAGTDATSSAKALRSWVSGSSVPASTSATLSAFSTVCCAGKPMMLAFSGRIADKALKPGQYQAVFTANDAAGSSIARAIAFAIVAR